MNSLELCQKLIPGNVYSFDTNKVIRAGMARRNFISEVIFQELYQAGDEYFVIYKFQKHTPADYLEAFPVKELTRILGTLKDD